MTPILLDLARKAGFDDPIDGWMGEAYEERLVRFAKLIIEHETKKQEPVAWIRWDDEENYYDVRRTPPPQEAIEYLAKWNRPPWVPAYPHPAAAPRQPLTEEQIRKLWDGHVVPVFGKNGINPIVFARAVEAAHKIGGAA